MTEQTPSLDQAESTRGDSSPTGSKQAAGDVSTEGSARVLNEVKGRLERIETGELPVIEKIGADGSTRRVDPTGEMIRPDGAHIDAARLDAVNEAAEAFANQHHAPAADQPPSAGPSVSAADRAPRPSGAERKGLWARIMSWFRRD
ncbi:MAG TPA: hypothetical protein VFN21_07025 [Acidimicrobiales bacterium]|nr:hypothetical protein [Acidimicrobiales bacterium]